MSEVIKNKYLDFSGLKKYDILIKALIESGNKELAAAIDALDAKIGSFEIEGSDDKNIAESIAEIYASIAEIVVAQDALEDKDVELALKITALEEELDFITGTDSDNEATLGNITIALTNLQNELSTLKESVETNVAQAQSVANEAKGIAEGAATVAGEAKADATQAKTDAADAKSAVDALSVDVNANSAAIDILTGEGDGSVKKIASDAAAAAVAGVIDGAPESFDTLKEVAAWIAADKEGSAALQTTVSGHTESINKINGELDALEAKVDGDIANLTQHVTDAANALAQVETALDARIDVLEAFEETHESISLDTIEGLFA
jgi:chromosome segregation ATPase